jgi:hypothetical protein
MHHTSSGTGLSLQQQHHHSSSGASHNVSSVVVAAATAAAAGTMPPASYDDLNNIFEEESSDEQQQQQPAPQQQQQQQPSTSSSSSTFNNGLLSASNANNFQQFGNNNSSQSNTVMSTMSVVMTPPSHETKYDEQMNLLTTTTSQTGLANCAPLGNNSAHFPDTRSLILNDYASLVYDKLATRTLLDEFTVSKMSLTGVRNKYVRVVEHQQHQQQQQQHQNLNSKWPSNSATVIQRSKKQQVTTKYTWTLSSTANGGLPASLPPPHHMNQLHQSKTKQPDKTSLSSMMMSRPSASVTSQFLASGGSLLMPTITVPQLRIKPLDKFLLQLDAGKVAKSNLNMTVTTTTTAGSIFSTTFINSVCLSVALSDTLMNAQRDVNFDTCTLCVCSNNSIKSGSDYSTLIANDIYANRPFEQPVQQSLSQQQQQQNSSEQPSSNSPCTCGFSSLINRTALSRNASCLPLGQHLSTVEDNRYPLVSLLNGLMRKETRNSQLFVLDANNCNGLFIEDYAETLGVCSPHQLVNALLSQQQSHHRILSAALVSRHFLNSIVLTDVSAAKKPLAVQQQQQLLAIAASTTAAVTTPNRSKSKAAKQEPISAPDSLNSSLSKQPEQQPPKSQVVSSDLMCSGTTAAGYSILDAIDLTYSNPFLTVYDTFDVFYDNEAENRELVFAERQGARSLNQFDENSVCRNAVNTLLSTTTR